MILRDTLQPCLQPALGGVGRFRLDPLTKTFQAESGATDVSVTNEIIKYARAEGFIDNLVLYPLKSAQNAGSGSTAYGVGGLTTNDMTLVNSPTWGSSGLTLNGTNQYGSISDFLADNTLYVFTRLQHASATTSFDETIFSQFEGSTTDQSVLFTRNGTLSNDPYQLLRSSDGGSTNREIYRDDGSDSGTSDKTLVCNWIDGGGRNLWINKTSKTLTLISGTSQTSKLNTSVDILMGAYNPASPRSFGAGTFTAQCFVNTSLTSTQREKLTDLINAL
jgi:hypothetical protein